jgi:hypothetical protein
MKTKFAALALVLAWILLPAAYARQAREPQPPVQEPDTDARTQTRVIGENQKIVYRFHSEVLHSWDDSTITLAFFDTEAEEFDQADNWCTSWIGKAPSLGQSYNAFSVQQRPGAPEESAWKKPFWDSPPKWTMWKPYGDMEDVGAADMVLTFSRKGKNVQAVLEIDGMTAWKGRQSVGNLTNDQIYLYLSVKNRTLSNIEFQDLGGAGWLPSLWGRLLLTAAVLVGSYFLHLLAKKVGYKLFVTDDIAALLAAGLFACGFILFLLFYGRSHPNILSVVSLGCLSFPLAAGGPGFWIPAVIFGLITAVCAVSLLWLAHEDLCNPAVYLLGAVPLGFCHDIWIAAVAYIIFQSLGQIFQLILAILAIVVLYFLGRTLNEMDKKPHIERTVVTRIYNADGNLVDAKYDVDYVELPEEKRKPK